MSGGIPPVARDAAPADSGSSYPAARRIQYYIASSLDGFIAREDGRVDWLPTSGDFGFRDFYRSVDTVILGRKTWEQSLTFEKNPFGAMTRVVFSRSSQTETREGVQLLSGDVPRLVRELRARPGTNICLVGGSELAAAFFAEGVIDDVIVTWVPILLGQGIPLFRPQPRESALELVSVTKLGQGLAQTRYRAVRTRPR